MIRPFREADADAVVALWEAAGLLRPWNDPRRDIDRKLAVEDDLFLVAEEDGVIVGSAMAGYDGHRGWVNYLAVRPEHRRRGVGRALMSEAERRLRMHGCPKVNVQVHGGDAAAVAFYRSLGYRTDDVVSLGRRLIPDR